MTPRQRIVAALSRQVPDRTPTDGWFHHEVQRQLKAHYGTDDWNEVLAELGVEGWAGCGIGLRFPEYAARATPRPGGEPGSVAIWLDERTYENPWGVRHRIGAGGWYEEWVDGPLTGVQSAREVEEYPLPGVENIAEPADYAAQVARLKSEEMFVRGGIPNPYKMAWMLRGMDNVLADYLINRDDTESDLIIPDDSTNEWIIPCEPPSEATRLWHAALGELELQMTRVTFNTWIKPLACLSLDRDACTATLQAPNAYIADWITERLSAPITRTLAGVADLPPDQFSFTCQTSEQQ